MLNLLRYVNSPILEARYDLEVRTVWLDNEIVEIATADRDCRLKSPAPLRSVSIRKRNGIGFGLFDNRLPKPTAASSSTSRMPEAEQSFALPCPRAEKWA